MSWDRYSPDESEKTFDDYYKEAEDDLIYFGHCAWNERPSGKAIKDRAAQLALKNDSVDYDDYEERIRDTRSGYYLGPWESFPSEGQVIIDARGGSSHQETFESEPNDEAKQEEPQSPVTFEVFYSNDLEEDYSLEEKIYQEYANLGYDDLLQKLGLVINDYPENSIQNKAGLKVLTEARSLKNNLYPSEIRKWRMSVSLAIHVFVSKFDEKTVKLLELNATNRAIGHADGWAQFNSALVALVGVGLISLGYAGIPFADGLGLSEMYMSGSLLTAVGATFFYRNREQSLAKDLATLVAAGKQMRG